MTTHFDSPLSASFQVDEETRTIRGLAVPYGQPARSKGVWFQFSRDSMVIPTEPNRVKLLVGHDFNRAVGTVTEFENTDEGLFITARIGKGADGDEVLAKASEGIWDGLSVGLGNDLKTRLTGRVQHALSAPLIEVSVTPLPSFSDARITSVAASATPLGDPMENDLETPVAPTFDAQPLADAIREGFAALPVREPVSASGATFDEVNEQPLYRFDGIAGQRSLIEDMRAGQQGDSEARERIGTYFSETFAVATGNVSSLNPTVHRPDMFVPNLHYSRPLWEAVSTGSIDNKTAQIVPKYASHSGLVGPHTEGVEPTPGAFAAASQTITPSAVSGKIEVNREVIDQGGSPQLDQMLWTEMVAGYYEAIEQKIAAALAAVPTAEVNLASAVDAALVDRMTDLLASLQFVRGGNRYTSLVLDGQLFPKLVSAKDSTGRKLLPVLNPTNADGSVSGAFDSVSLGGLTGRAAWALGGTTAAKSYLFVPSSVFAWASAPSRFEFQYQVKSVDIAIWGYTAAAVTRDSDVLPIDYTTTDA